IDPDGVVASLSIYMDGEQIGASTNGDISIPWSPRVAGNYTFSVTATDNLGLTVTLDNIIVTVTGKFPKVSIINPVPTGFAYDSPTGKPITVAVEASIEAPYQITNVSVFALGNLIGSFSQPPYTLEWTPHQINYHQIIVEADSDSGAITKTVLWVN